MVRSHRPVTSSQWVIVMIAIIAITVVVWCFTVRVNDNFCPQCWEEGKLLIKRWIEGIKRILSLPRGEIICRPSCKGNLLQLRFSILAYASDHDGRLPNHKTWEQQVFGYLRNRDIYRCPDAHVKRRRYYCMNPKLSNKKLKDIVMPQNTVLLYECDDNSKPIAYHHYMEFKHLCNVAFANGQIKGLLSKEVEKLLKSPKR